jgi:hypothetical protein
MRAGWVAGAVSVDRKSCKSNEPVRVVERERPKQHAVDDGEDGRRRTDAECEREDDDSGEAWTPAQRARGVLEVEPDHVHGSVAAPEPERVERRAERAPEKSAVGQQR